MKIFLILILLVVLISGCGIRVEKIDSVIPYHKGIAGIERYMDNEYGVVCWVYKSGYAGGISCLPISDTLLGE
jgi:hypothetical protein